MPIQISISNSVGARSATASGGIDPDAQAFITAAAITDPTQQAAINTLVVDLKGYSIWTKMQALYPMVGGTATSNSYNLKNTAQYQISWAGGVVSSSNGVQFNGINSWGNTGFNISTQTTLNDFHFSFYSRTNTPANNIDIGASTSNVADYYLIQTTGGTTYNFINESAYQPSYPNFADADTRGLYLGTRNGTVVKAFKNGTVRATKSPASTAARPNFNMYLGAWNVGGFAGNYSSKQHVFASIGDGLTDAESGNLYTAVQAFQTTLGRSIGTQTVSDADAQAFVTAADIQDQVEANAINNLVIGMKADGTWSKMKAIYPFVGGTASTHKFNLKNPLDTDAAFRLTFSGGWTHSANGALPNGTNAYANTFLNLNTMNSINDISFGYYSRTNSVSNGSFGWASLSPPVELYIRYTGNLKYGYLFDLANDGGAATDCRGLNSMSRTASNQKYIQINNTIASYSSASSGSLSSKIFQFALGTQTYEDRQNSFGFIGNGLTNTELTNLYTAVQAYQTSLSRQV